MAGPIVVLDACVFIPAGPRDTLLRVAQAGLYQPCWTDAILDEVERNLAPLLAQHGHHDAARKAERLIATLRREFPRALVADYETLVPQMTNDPKARHVLAAALAAQARLIVTENLRDFPTRALLPHRVEAKSSDAFLAALFAEQPERMVEVLVEQGADLRQPRTIEQVLGGLEPLLPRLIAAVRRHPQPDAR